LDWIAREFGKEPIPIETAGLQRVGPLLRLRDDLVQSTRKEAELCEALLARERWDLFLVALGGTHRAGHKLWDRTSVEGPMSPDEAAEYDRALRDVHVACDATVGRIVRAAGPDCRVLVFALHGMTKSTSRFDLLPEMLARVLAGSREPRGADRPKHALLERLRAALPVEWRASVKQRLSPRLQDTLTKFWRAPDARDWARTRAFPVMGDLQAMVQVNLRGRERLGIVEPGREYDALCAQIAEGLLTFADADTGERVIGAIGRGTELYPEARYTVGLPDLVVRWTDTPCATHRAIVSPRYGTVAWPLPGHPLDGRSGHHGPDGWLIAAGDGIPAGAELRGASIFDLNATIHALLGVERPPEMHGVAIRELCGALQPSR
jgi:predicted AlkP superfamily phosphohydrolase/phosphomutase